MNFLAPWYVPLIAAAATIPPLVLLYFLKLKRREVPIGSTLLWRKAVHDLQVNAPFQRLRNSLLLWLQLLILVIAIIAICEPMWAGSEGEGIVQVILVDCSASMAAEEGEGETRLELARKEAHTLIDNMRKKDRAMVIAFASRARVLSPLTDSTEALHRAVDMIRQTDEPGRLSEAIRLAQAPTSKAGEYSAFGNVNELESMKMVMFTDGRLPDADEVTVDLKSFEIVRIGKVQDNVGIVALDVRRRYERPELLSVVANVRNFGSQTVTRDVSLVVDGVLKPPQTVELAPLTSAASLEEMELESIPPEGNEATAVFELELATAAEIEVRLSGKDAFDADNRAYAVVTPPRSMTALLVTGGNRYLRAALDALPLEKYDVWSPPEYEKEAEQYEKGNKEKLTIDGRCLYDVVIMDNYSTSRLPPGSYLFFGGVPLIEGVAKGNLQESAFMLDWDDTHPILRHVLVQNMAVVSWFDLILPSSAQTLIEASNGPVLSLLQAERHLYLICAFGIFDDNRQFLNAPWVLMDSGYVVFMYNALRYLSGSSTRGAQPAPQPGGTFTVAARPSESSITITRPDGETEEMPVRSSGLVTYGQTDQAGIYRASTGIAGEDARAVNLLDAEESFIAPNARFRISQGEVATAQAVEATNRPLWPYVLAAMGLILLVEWIVYNRRMFV
jgi:hypothetical protein